MKPTERQIDFATEIAETIGDDLPEEYTKEAYSEWIDERYDEFKRVQYEIRKERHGFYLKHSYVLGKGFNGDTKLNINPET